MKVKRKIFWGALITLGIVYGDIGTSPLYVMKALIMDAGGLNGLTEDYIIGCLSLVFWTLMLMTTIKYVLIALRADITGVTRWCGFISRWNFNTCCYCNECY